MKPEQAWRIRAATGADVAAIVAIDHASFTQPWSPRSFEKAVANTKTIALVAHPDTAARVQAASGDAAGGEAVNDKAIGGEIVGFGVAYTVGDEGEVLTLAIAATARGCGLGRTLLQTLLQQCAARGARQMFLEVRAGNTNAQRLYERCGFAPVGLRRRYYADGEDAIVMKKVLAAS